MARLACILIITAMCDQIVALPFSSDLISSIQKVQKQHSGKTLDGAANSVRVAVEENSTEAPLSDDKQVETEPPVRSGPRQHKMLGFYGYLPAFAPIPAFYPTLPIPGSEYYGDYNNYIPYSNYPINNNNINSENDEDNDEAMSRANQKKRPNQQFKNSPIYYIRLPPTPYMFVPGLGYISQPPTIQPMAPVMPPPPPPPAMPVSPFYNVPINFVSNAKPTGVYQWPSPMSPTSQAPGHYSPYPAQRPQRPYRPTYRPPISQSTSNYAQPDSKITNLKGSFLFNGRPEEIYLLPQNPYTSGYYHPDPYSYQNYQQGYSGYY